MRGIAAGRLLGRAREVQALGAFLTRQEGGSAALVLEGPAGIGKTSLWERGVAIGREMALRVLVSRASAAENSSGR